MDDGHDSIARWHRYLKRVAAGGLGAEIAVLAWGSLAPPRLESVPSPFLDLDAGTDAWLLGSLVVVVLAGLLAGVLSWMVLRERQPPWPIRLRRGDVRPDMAGLVIVLAGFPSAILRGLLLNALGLGDPTPTIYVEQPAGGFIRSTLPPEIARYLIVAYASFFVVWVGIGLAVLLAARALAPRSSVE